MFRFFNEKKSSEMKGSSAYKSVKWISSSSDGVLQVNEDAKDVFAGITEMKCNMISIFGLARQGKSFLMNCLANEDSIFTVSDKMDPCTQGIDISDKWLDLSSFSAIDGGRKVSGCTTVGFIDAEGQGDQDVTYDAKLVCPILLASKCVIYNYKGELHKDKLLETLGIMGRAARNVGSDASIQRGQKKFSHLHIVFRDWQFESGAGAAQQAFSRIFDTEGTREAQTRDAIRQEVLESFASVNVWLFEAPTDTSKLRGKLTLGVTSASFRQQLRDFRYALSQQLSEPLNFAGRPLTGRTVAPLMKSIVSSLNDGGSVLPDSAFANMMRAELEQLRTRLDKQLNSLAQDVLGDLTAKSQGANAFIVTEAEACAILSQQLDDLVAAFEVDKAAAVGEVTDDLARRVLGDTAAEVLRIRGNVERGFLTGYQAAFGAWLRMARQNAEQVIASLMVELLSKDVGLTTVDLEARFSAVWSEATELLGVSKYAGSDSSKECVEDAAQQVRRMWEADFEKAKVMNTKRQHQEEARMQTLLRAAITKMEGMLQQAATALSVSSPTGYSLGELESKLNQFYFNELDELRGAAFGGSYADQLEDNYEEACQNMRPLMTSIYSAAVDAAFQQALVSAKGKIGSSLAEMGYMQVGQIFALLSREVMVDLEGWNLDPTVLQERILGPLTNALYTEAELLEQQEQLESMIVDAPDDSGDAAADAEQEAATGIPETTSRKPRAKTSRKSVATAKRPKKKSAMPSMPTIEEQLTFAAQFKSSYTSKQPATSTKGTRRKSMAPVGKQTAATTVGAENVPPTPPFDPLATAKESAAQKQRERQAAAVAALGERATKKK